MRQLDTAVLCWFRVDGRLLVASSEKVDTDCDDGKKHNATAHAANDGGDRER